MLSRRDTLRLSAGLSLGLGALAVTLGGVVAAAGSGSSSGLDNPQQRLTTFMRLAAALDDRLVIWWMTGIRYGVVDAICRPLHGMQVGMFHQFAKQADGTWRFAILELTYYTDLESGALLETYANQIGRAHV